jgi:wyosine [tRNA(Phe)-imidazoG37] synthetase (radical SAM superfamily)
MHMKDITVKTVTAFPRTAIRLSLSVRRPILRFPRSGRPMPAESPNILYADHARTYEGNRFVYPVLSRRSKGISIGVNLNPDKVCNFDCIYCQVDRRSEAETTFVETEALFAELDAMMHFVGSGEIFADPKFAHVPPELRRWNDIAFSGDGEPTTHRNFDDVVERTADLKRRHGLVAAAASGGSEAGGFRYDDVKLVLITNASMFHRPHVQRALRILDENNGEIWAKLDAGTDGYYHLIERTKIPFRRILDNITAAARLRPLVIQSLFMRVHGDPPSEAEIAAFCDRLNEITTAGGQIKLVQIYTVARQPAESYVAHLSKEAVDAIATTMETQTRLNVERYYGPD